MYDSKLSLLTDFYQLTMMQGYYTCGMASKKVVFDLTYRSNPYGNGFAVAAGLEQAIQYIEAIRFSKDDIGWLKTQGPFTEDFLKALSNFRFSGGIKAVPEGSVIFPHEPIVRVEAPVFEAQFIETALLNIINHQSLIATKAARVAYAAGEDTVLEFGLRRAQGPDAGVYGTRAAIIGGCDATSNVLAGQKFGIPIRGTHAHSWVMSFPDELSAFRAYANVFPEGVTLLADTYDTLKSGVPNAIAVFHELREAGRLPKGYGIRLDSGDLAYLSKAARQMLDDAGFKDAVISASSDLDEMIIRDLKLQGAKITVWGVGTNLITSQGWSAFGGVYKMAAEEDETGRMRPVIKLSENPEKVTNPGVKEIVRLYDKKTGKIKADLITLAEETIDPKADLTIFDPKAVWKKMTLKGGSFEARNLLVPVFVGGERVYESPDVLTIRATCKNEQATLWGEHRRLVNPHELPVDLSPALWNLKQQMIRRYREA